MGQGGEDAAGAFLRRGGAAPGLGAGIGAVVVCVVGVWVGWRWWVGRRREKGGKKKGMSEEGEGEGVELRGV